MSSVSSPSPFSPSPSSSERPSDVGILAMDIYFPSTYVKQTELETFTGVSAGKYTLGLGQQGLAFVNDREDIYSICLTVVKQLLDKYQIPETQIGRLEVATETIQDHSKAVKTVLMQLFTESGNTDIEGIDCMNACYAGTSAFLNSVAWVESRDWDGRYALVVAADIAEYAEGPARPTGGCGAVAFLIGPNAPLVLDHGVRTSHMEHAYDFYKPHMHSPYPVVDGKFSNQCYLRSLDVCYSGYCRKYQSRYGSSYDFINTSDYFIFHAPYNKLVQKSYARLMFNDFLLHPDRPQYATAQAYRNVDKTASYEDVALEKTFVTLSSSSYAARVAPSILLPTQLGNLYTASLYAGLLSLIVTSYQQLPGKHIMMFSYGSGLASTLFSLRVGTSPSAIAQLTRIATLTSIESRLASRIAIAPSVFTEVMRYREKLHGDASALQPQGDLSTLVPGTYYLVNKDSQGRRFYQQYQYQPSNTNIIIPTATTTTATATSALGVQ